VPRDVYVDIDDDVRSDVAYYELQGDMHSIQGAKASITRWWAIWHRAKEMPDMRFVYRMEGFAVPLLPLQIEN
jgi:hypothetical protein